MQKGHCGGVRRGSKRSRGGVCGGSECKKVIARRFTQRGCAEGVHGGVRGGSECKKVIVRRGARRGCDWLIYSQWDL